MEPPKIDGVDQWRPLARGGLALVWEARQRSLDRSVAVKVYQRALNETDRRRFLREATAAGRLSNHPGIVTTYDAGVLPDDRPYLMMELCPGGSLTRWLRPESRRSEERIRQTGVRIADALAATHAFGVLHRDVKPANILIDSFGNPGLADFGLAAVGGIEMSAEEAVLLTPAYAAPEAFRTQPATGAGDVYSLAATLYALFAGHPPHGPSAAPATLQQLVERAERPIDPLPGVSRQLMNLLLAALSHDPLARPSAAELRDQLATAGAPRPPGRGRLAAVSADSASANAHNGPAVATSGTESNDHSVTARAWALAAESRPAAQPTVDSSQPRSRAKGRTAMVALATTLVMAVVGLSAWLVNAPASSGSAAATRSSASSMATMVAATSSARPSLPSGRAAAGPQQVLSTCRSKVRAGDTVIDRAEVGVSHVSEYVKARSDATAGRITQADMTRIINRVQLAGPRDLRRYQAAVKAYADRGQPCASASWPSSASSEMADHLKGCARREAAQAPVLASAANLSQDWEAHQADMRRSRTGHVQTTQATWIRTWSVALPHLAAWQDALASYHPDSC